jgi:transcriptional regulator with XRE-family HTH domain
VTARVAPGALLGWAEGRAAVTWARQARAAAGLRQQDLAAVLGVSATWVVLRETGATRMTDGEVTAIAGALRIPVPDLTGGAG